MGRKKKEVVVAPVVSNVPTKTYMGFSREQDMLTFVYLWNSRKDLQAQCKEAVRKIKGSEQDLMDAIKIIAINGTSPRASIYQEILDDFNNLTNWSEIAAKIKEKMAVGD